MTGVLRLCMLSRQTELPWLYPIMLAGREPRRFEISGPCDGMEVFVNGVRYVPARERDWDDMECE